ENAFPEQKKPRIEGGQTAFCARILPLWDLIRWDLQAAWVAAPEKTEQVPCCVEVVSSGSLACGLAQWVGQMDPATFSVLRKLAERHTGQRLEQAKAALFATRLKRFAYRSGYTDIDDIAKYLDVRDEGSNLDLQIATAMLDRYSCFVPERGAMRPCTESASTRH
ncbi:MAG: hypothetical protein LRY51_00740, partial [Geovibrio sp.]|nr:hypothetical protein [Geovibrio sp.]